MKRVYILPGFAAGVILCFTSSVRVHAATVNFDSIVLAPAQCANATSYLADFGITFVHITPGTTPVICNGTGTAAIPSSPPNWFAVNAAPGQGNAPLSYKLEFSELLTEISFTRVGIISGSTGPPWMALALSASGDILDSVGEGGGGLLAQTFMLNGPGIKSVRIDANNSVASTFTDPPFDDLIFTTQTSPVPEPGTLSLFFVGSSAFALYRMFKRRTMRPEQGVHRLHTLRPRSSTETP